jgi:hypothetical protein
MLTVKKEVLGKNAFNNVSEKIIQEIVSRRKSRKNLSEDLNDLAHKLLVMNTWMNKARAGASELSHGKFQRLIEMLNI